jgi:hypothetical protein
MTPEEAAIARSRGYALVARAVAAPPDEDVWEALRSIDGLDDLPAFDADEVAADHFSAFGTHAPPFAGLYLDDPPLLGGPADAWRARRLPGTLDSPPEHFGSAAYALAMLAMSAPDAGSSLAGRHQRWVGMVAADLLAWAPPFLLAAERGPVRWAAAVVGLGVELAASEGVELQLELVPRVDPFADPSAGLRTIAEWATTPAQTGWLFGAGEARQVARAVGLPETAGNRVDACEALLRAAVDHGLLDAVVDEVQRRHDEADARYAAWAAFGVPVAAWRSRLAEGRAGWGQLRRRVAVN